MNTNCVFCKIINKEINSNIIYEDDNIIAFNDIHPKAKVHFLLVPKMHINSMFDVNNSHQNLLGNLMIKASELANTYNLSGYKIHINNGESGGQEVFHLHIHVYGE